MRLKLQCPYSRNPELANHRYLQDASGKSGAVRNATAIGARARRYRRHHNFGTPDTASSAGASQLHGQGYRAIVAKSAAALRL